MLCPRYEDLSPRLIIGKVFMTFCREPLTAGLNSAIAASDQSARTDAGSSNASPRRLPRSGPDSNRPFSTTRPLQARHINHPAALH
jgi:hypothetical protein